MKKFKAKCITQGCNRFAGSLGKNRGDKYLCRGCDIMFTRARKAGDDPSIMTRQELENKYWNMREKEQDINETS